MAKSTTKAPKPARSKTRTATTKPRTVAKTVVKKTATTMAAAPDQPATATDGALPVEVSKKELIERMVRDGEMKKGDARRALDAVLTVLGEVLAEGSNIAAAPLGKIKIARTKETPTGQLVVCRVKLKKPETLLDKMRDDMEDSAGD